MKTSKKIPTINRQFNFGKIFSLILVTCFLLTQKTIVAQNTTAKNACLKCHKRVVKKSFIHGPVASDCVACHKPTGEKHPIENVKGFTLLKEGSELCYTCHKKIQETIATDKHVHPPVKKGECLECHDIHSSNEPNFVFSKAPDLCFFCHGKLEKLISKSKVVHLPATEEGGCIKCHSPHSSHEKKLLVKNKKALCLECHNKIITVGNRQIADINKIINESKVQHPALKKRCTGCHTPHATNNSYLLKYPFPTQNYAPASEETYALCFQCHDPDLLLEKNTETSTEFRNGDRNLHYVHVNKVKGRTCLNCHAIHGASGKHIVPETTKFGSWDMPLNYNPTSTGGSCAPGCHVERKYDRAKVPVKQ